MRDVDARPANAWRGEASLMIAGHARLLRPSFGALVAAEDELGPLLALVDRAAAGQLRLTEVAALFWHCLAAREGLSREIVSDAVIAAGLGPAMVPLRQLIAQIIQGAG